MRAMIIRGFGGPEVFERVEMSDPVPGPGQVVVRQRATSVNPVDYKIRAAGPPIAPELPAVLGCDVCGTIEAVGEGVTGLRAGEAVFGCAGGVRGLNGAYAELIATDPALLAPKPEKLSFREAAALPLVAITAWEGLTRAEAGSGQKVLIHGGAGGVGHVAIQLAKARGAEVFATVSSLEKSRLARDLGADHVINYKEQGIEDYVAQHTGGQGFDVVFDATGGSRIAESFAAARLNGQVVTIVAEYTADLSLMHQKGLSLHVVFMLIPLLHGGGREAMGAIMHEVGELADAGALRPLLDERRFTLDQLADAHRHAEGGGPVGKVVVDIAA